MFEDGYRGLIPGIQNSGIPAFAGMTPHMRIWSKLKIHFMEQYRLMHPYE